MIHVIYLFARFVKIKVIYHYVLFKGKFFTIFFIYNMVLIMIAQEQLK